MLPGQKSSPWGLSLLSLVLLAVQNTLLVLLIYTVRRKSRIEETPAFAPSASLLFSESVKFIICIVLALVQSRGLTPAFRSVRQHLEQSKLPKQMAIPAGIYLIQNLLLYVAMGNLDPVTFQVTYQLKLAATALFSILLLGRTFTKQQYLAMALLTCGILAVQLDLPKASPPAPVAVTRSTGAAITQMTRKVIRRLLTARTEGVHEAAITQPPNAWLGILATVTSAFTSGFAGVYFEKVLKREQTSMPDEDRGDQYSQVPIEDDSKDSSLNSTPLHEESNVPQSPKGVSILVMTNLILSFYTILALPFVIASTKGMSGLRPAQLTTGFGPLVWLIVLWQAMGGLLIAVVIKYADNVLKTFAITASIIASALIQIFAFGLRPGPVFAAGVLLSIASSWLYNVAL